MKRYSQASLKGSENLFDLNFSEGKEAHIPAEGPATAVRLQGTRKAVDLALKGASQIDANGGSVTFEDDQKKAIVDLKPVEQNQTEVTIQIEQK